MFGFLDTIFSWVFGGLFYFALARAEDIVTWLLPIYMTVEVLRKNEKTKFANYLSFWCLASLLFGIDWISGFLLHSILIFRIIRLIFLIWIFIDSCHNSVFVVNTFLTPVIDEHREQIDAYFNLLENKIDETAQSVTDKVKQHAGNVLSNQKDQLASGLLRAASVASNAITDVVSNASGSTSVSNEKNNNDISNPTNAEESNDKNKEDNTSETVGDAEKKDEEK